MEQLKKKDNIIFCGLFIFLTASSFVNHDVYAFTVRYDSLLIFLVLSLLALPYLAEDIRGRNADLIMTAATIVLSAVFVLITGSGYGAVFIPSDLALIAYVSGKLKLKQGSVLCLSFTGACPVILWYSHVRWSYNFNMAGFAFMLMAYFAMILVEEWRDGAPAFLSDHKAYFKWVIFITAFILSMLYHSRTVMAGMLGFAAVYLLFGMTVRHRWVRRLLFFLASAGAVLFTAAYVWIAETVGNARFLYKDVFSGREAIWRELWGAFLASPLTGIGSAYELKSFEIFEVHNGMFDILVVHGIIVFMLVLMLMYRRFEKVYVDKAEDIGNQESGLHKLGETSRLALAAAFSMMFTSWFENYFTVPPYSIFFMTFIMMADRRVYHDLLSFRADVV